MRKFSDFINEIANRLVPQCDCTNDDGVTIYSFPANDETLEFLANLPDDMDYEVSIGSDDNDDDFPEDGTISSDDTIYLAVFSDNLEDEEMNEVKRVIRVNSQGKRRIAFKCGKGFLWNPAERRCRPQTGKEKESKRRAIKKAVKTRKHKGAGFAKKVSKKRLKALAKRRQQGIK
jgi:hypothetical protein